MKICYQYQYISSILLDLEDHVLVLVLIQDLFLRIFKIFLTFHGLFFLLDLNTFKSLFFYFNICNDTETEADPRIYRRAVGATGEKNGLN